MRFKVLPEVLLGTGLGFGYLTSFRFFGPVGLPEIFVVVSLCLLIVNRPYGGLIYTCKLEKFIRIYLLATVFFVFPIVTFINYFFNDLNGSSPEYLSSFIVGILLMLWFSDAVRGQSINLKLLTFAFALSFIFANFYSLYFVGYETDSFDSRYTGGATNPNQLTFYASTLSIFLVAFSGRWVFILLPLVIFITLLSKSDAYVLSLAIATISYLLFHIFFFRCIFFIKRFIILLVFILLCVLIAINLFFEEIYQFWLFADEGGSRTALLQHGFLASIYSPLFGWGSGSFSGLNSAFDGTEAHNTFVDFSTQFGFLFPIIIYSIILMSFFNLLRSGRFFISALIVSYIESGLFHFSGRHFVFWIEMAVFMSYSFHYNSLKASYSVPRKLCA